MLKMNRCFIHQLAYILSRMLGETPLKIGDLISGIQSSNLNQEYLSTES